MSKYVLRINDKDGKHLLIDALESKANQKIEEGDYASAVDCLEMIGEIYEDSAKEVK